MWKNQQRPLNLTHLAQKREDGKLKTCQKMGITTKTFPQLETLILLFYFMSRREMGPYFKCHNLLKEEKARNLR